MIDRQKLIGWLIIGWSVGYLLWFLKARLFMEGTPIERKEWVYFWMSFGGVFLGTINVRMAAMRLRKKQ
jgi:hypothetical protein